MDNTFSYNYSAKEQEEIKRIEEKYMGKPELDDKMEQLRRLDTGVTTKAIIQSVAVGVIGTLLLGVGMCFTMVWTSFFVLGVIVGIVGIAILSFAYPVYKKVMKKEREKVAPQILALTAELKR